MPVANPYAGELDPGQLHQLVVRAPGYATQERVIRPADERVEVVLSRVTVGPSPKVPPPKPTISEPDSRGKKPTYKIDDQNPYGSAQ
jgi:hypothetical protein